MAQLFSIPLTLEFVSEHHNWHVARYCFAGRELDFKPPPETFPGTGISIPLIGAPMAQSNEVVFRLEGDIKHRLVGTNSLYKAYGAEEAASFDTLFKLEQGGASIPAVMKELLFCESKPVPSTKQKDPWAMREEFLSLEESTTVLASFLDRWGTWEPSTSLIGRFSGGESVRLGAGKTYPKFLLPQDVWTKRRAFRTGMLGTPAFWLSTRASLKLTHRRSQFPYLGILATCCSQAIEATITLDHLRKVKYRVCARADCNNIFALDSEHGKIYCQQYCGHLVSVRKRRAAEKKAKSVIRKGR